MLSWAHSHAASYACAGIYLSFAQVPRTGNVTTGTLLLLLRIAAAGKFRIPKTKKALLKTAQAKIVHVKSSLQTFSKWKSLAYAVF